MFLTSETPFNPFRGPYPKETHLFTCLSAAHSYAFKHFKILIAIVSALLKEIKG